MKVKVKGLSWLGYPFKISGDDNALNNLCRVFRDVAQYNQQRGHNEIAYEQIMWADKIHDVLEKNGCYDNLED